MNSPLVQESLARVVWSGAGLTFTLGDVLLALALVLGGGIASRLVAAVFRRRIAPRMAASRQTRELAPRWIFFGLWALFLLAASHENENAGLAAIDDVLDRMSLRKKGGVTASLAERLAGCGRLLLIQRGTLLIAVLLYAILLLDGMDGGGA